MKQEVGYYCALCQRNRYVRIDPQNHLSKVNGSANGLVEISDIHYCTEGMLSINNLHVDHNFSVRSFSLIELPDTKRQTMSLPGIPLPNQQIALNTYKINKMVEEGGYRIRLIDHRLRVNLNIGEVGKNEESMEHFVSEKKNVELYYFKSEVPLRKNNREWFNVLINTLEILPPTTIGLFIESIRFVYKHNKEAPNYFMTQQLKTLLTAHKTTLKVLRHNFRMIRNLTNKYGIEKREIIDQLLKILEDNPKLSLRNIQEKLNIDLVFLIFLCILLEMENIIEIYRDGTIITQ